MKISYSWIKEFAEVKQGPQELAESLTMAGLSVASLEAISGDWVYDIEVTSNRPDWLSVRGIVREVAAITGAKFKKQDDRKSKGKKNLKQAACGLKSLSVSIDDAKDCGLYYGNLIVGVKVGASPEWLKKKIETVGLRSINNIVDITNFCLMEYGQPLHAFDYDKLTGGEIRVRRGREGETLTLIDGSEKKLTPAVLVIADAKKPVAIAGIMGARDTEVSLSTVNVMLESACFSGLVVRRGTRVLGVATDSSYRFERGVDIVTVKTALDAATQMICELCGGALCLEKRAGKEKEASARKIAFRLARACDILSVKISLGEAKSILEKLGFGVKRKPQDILEVSVPSFRRDVKIEEDVTEEIARVYGYEKIPLTTPQIRPFAMAAPKVQKLEPVVKNILLKAGLKEAVTYSLMSDEHYAKSMLGQSTPGLVLENPLSSEYRCLRTTLVPSLLECAAYNVTHNNPNLELFEMARVYDLNTEKRTLGILLCGARRATWQNETKVYTLFDLKGILEVLLQELKICGVSVERAATSWLDSRIMSGPKLLASFGQVPETVKKNWGIKSKEDIFVAEIPLDTLAESAVLKKVFRPLATTPTISRDISVLAHDETSFADIKKLIKERSSGYLKKVGLIECYQGKEVPKGYRGLTISLEYGSDTKTLTDAGINPVHQNILESLVKELSLTLR